MVKQILRLEGKFDFEAFGEVEELGKTGVGTIRWANVQIIDWLERHALSVETAEAIDCAGRENCLACQRGKSSGGHSADRGINREGRGECRDKRELPAVHDCLLKPARTVGEGRAEDAD